MKRETAGSVLMGPLDLSFGQTDPMAVRFDLDDHIRSGGGGEELARVVESAWRLAAQSGMGQVAG